MAHQFSAEPCNALPVFGPLDSGIVFGRSGVVAKGKAVILLGWVGRYRGLGVQLSVENADIGGDDEDEEGGYYGVRTDGAVGPLGGRGGRL